MENGRVFVWLKFLCHAHQHRKTLVSGLKKQCDQLGDEKWNISCHISKQRMSQASAVVASNDWELVSPEGTQEGKHTCHPAAIRLQPLPTVSPKETRDVKTQDTGTRELRYL